MSKFSFILIATIGINLMFSCEKSKIKMTVIKDCTGTYLRKNSQDFYVCNDDILESYSKAEFFTLLPEIDKEIKVVTYVAAEGDISTDLLSPGNQAHSRSDRELHGKCLISDNAQKEIRKLQEEHPGKRVMLIAEKGTMGVGSSRMSGVNNVALWTGIKSSPYIPFVNISPIVAGTNGISPIFLTKLTRLFMILNLKSPFINWIFFCSLVE